MLKSNRIFNPLLVILNREYWLESSKTFWIFGFSVFLLMHLVILPAEVLGGDIGLSSFRVLTVNQIIFAVSFAFCKIQIVHSWRVLRRSNRKCGVKLAGAGGAIAIFSPLLCCTPILPTIMSIVALVTPAFASKYGIGLQYIANVYQTELLLSSLSFLLIALYFILRSLTRYDCFQLQ